MIRIAPSVLAADFARLKDEVLAVGRAGAEFLHLDVMDGHFVPNISFGAPVIASLRPHCSLLFDVHLMITNPADYIEDFAKAGADLITFHYESSSDAQKTIEKIHACGCKAGIAIKPATPPEVLCPFLGTIEMVLVMSVEPGFGGQSFMENMMPKLTYFKKWAEAQKSPLWIQVDGGINEQTAGAAAAAGADILVAGSAIFGADDYSCAVQNIRNKAADAYAVWE